MHHAFLVQVLKAFQELPYRGLHRANANGFVPQHFFVVSNQSVQVVLGVVKHQGKRLFVVVHLYVKQIEHVLVFQVC